MKKATKKRWLSALLVAIMTAGSLAACGGEPASTESSGAAESKVEESSQAPEESAPEESGEESGEEAGGEAEAPAEGGAGTAEALLMEPYPEPVDIHIVLQYRESENPDTPADVTPETSTAVKLLLGKKGYGYREFRREKGGFPGEFIYLCRIIPASLREKEKYGEIPGTYRTVDVGVCGRFCSEGAEEYEYTELSAG